MLISSTTKTATKIHVQGIARSQLHNVVEYMLDVVRLVDNTSGNIHKTILPQKMYLQWNLRTNPYSRNEIDCKVWVTYKKLLLQLLRCFTNILQRTWLHTPLGNFAATAMTSKRAEGVSGCSVTGRLCMKRTLNLIYLWNQHTFHYPFPIFLPSVFCTPYKGWGQGHGTDCMQSWLYKTF